MLTDMHLKLILVYVGGFHSLGFAIFHSLFWKLFNWKQELKKVSYVNRGIFQILNLRLIYFFLFVAITCFWFGAELLQTSLGQFFMGAVSLFWLGRTIEQVVFIKINDVKVHLLTLAFIVGTIVFALPVLM